PALPPTPPGVPNFADLVSQTNGSVTVHTESFLMGGDLNYRHRLMCGCNFNLDLLLGFRYMHLDETLDITENGFALGNPNLITLTDHFRTINNFYGYQIGLLAHKQWGPWSADLNLKLAAGTTQQVVEIAGANNFAAVVGVTPPPPPNAGLFAHDNHIGRFSHNNFSVVPQVGLYAGHPLTPRI